MRSRLRQRIRKKMNRSGNIECNICGNKEILIIHHILGRKIRNHNHPSNIANLCSNCHRKCHEGLIIIEGWLKTSNGLQLFWHSVEEESFSGMNSKTYIIP